MSRIIPAKVGLRPDTSVSGAILFQTERTALLGFNAVDLGGEAVGKAMLAFGHCWVTHFGYPNDEAHAADKLAPGLVDFSGIGEVLESPWLIALRECDTRLFPNVDWFLGAKHFVVTFHDSTFHCIARTMAVQLQRATFSTLCAEAAAVLGQE